MKDYSYKISPEKSLARSGPIFGFCTHWSFLNPEKIHDIRRRPPLFSQSFFSSLDSQILKRNNHIWVFVATSCVVHYIHVFITELQKAI